MTQAQIDQLVSATQRCARVIESAEKDVDRVNVDDTSISVLRKAVREADELADESLHFGNSPDLMHRRIG
ncbi:MAG: hypothetical protein AAGD38_23370 [Acidobacteriota bacterium]